VTPFEKSLTKLKKELEKMGVPETKEDFCGNRVCFLCRDFGTLPAHEAMISVLFLGHDMALATPEKRLHVLTRHFCKVHISLFYEFMKVEKRDSFGA
jgi:hypothetical protein